MSEEPLLDHGVYLGAFESRILDDLADISLDGLEFSARLLAGTLHHEL
jgi:hypothetical protein